MSWKAVTQAEEVLKTNPDNLDARRMLGRIYTRMIPENQGRVDERAVRRYVRFGILAVWACRM